MRYFTKLSFVVALCFFTSVGCGKSGDADVGLAEAGAKLNSMAEAVCACADKACAKAESEKATDYSMQLSQRYNKLEKEYKEAAKSQDKEAEKKFEAMFKPILMAQIKMFECQEKQGVSGL